MASTDLQSRVSSAITSAVSYIERTGIETFDPVDISTHEFSQRVLTVRTVPGTLLRRLLWTGTYIAPQWTRRQLGVKRNAMASGVANLASLYLELEGDENRAKAERWLQWLREHAIVTDEYLGWGFPFPWKQRLLVLAGTPIAHTTMTCANSFLKYYHSTGSESALGVLNPACNFFHVGLRHSPRGNDSVALSYTPLDEMHIINVQADIASLLLRVWAITKEERHRSLGLKLLRCVLETQNSDGSWGYYAPDTSRAHNFVDNHHTGMVLSALAEIEQSNILDGEVQDLMTALINGTKYFLKYLFDERGVPKYLSTALYPIEIYNFAQSIITCLDLRASLSSDCDLAKDVERRLQQIVVAVLDMMRTKEGGFLYRRTRWCKQDLGSLRWANALTTAALARWLREERLTHTPSRSAKHHLQRA